MEDVGFTTWRPVDATTPRAIFVLTRRKGRSGNPDHIVSARKLPGVLGSEFWRDTNGQVILMPDSWMELPPQ